MTAMTNDPNDIQTLRAQIIHAIPKLGADDAKEAPWLLGTVGCHLCTDAQQLLAQFQCVYPVSYQYVDISDFDDTLMMAFATSIPVLLTSNERLDFPFSLMDLQRLLT